MYAVKQVLYGIKIKTYFFYQIVLHDTCSFGWAIFWLRRRFIETWRSCKQSENSYLDLLGLCARHWSPQNQIPVRCVVWSPLFLQNRSSSNLCLYSKKFLFSWSSAFPILNTLVKLVVGWRLSRPRFWWGSHLSRWAIFNAHLFVCLLASMCCFRFEYSNRSWTWCVFQHWFLQGLLLVLLLLRTTVHFKVMFLISIDRSVKPVIKCFLIWTLKRKTNAYLNELK